MKSHAAGIVAVLSTLGALPAARAETVGVVAVREPPGPTAELVDLTLQLRAAAEEREPGVLQPGQLRERMTGQTSSATLAELDRAYAGALATFQNGEFAGSVRTLHAVIDDLEKLPDGPEPFAQWTRAMLRLARSEQTLGHKEEAAKLIERLVRADPAVKADPMQYPPSFGKQLRAAEVALHKLPVRKLVVDSTSNGARVFLDGRDVGAAPLTLSVPQGRYRVAGQLGELRVPRIAIDVTEERQTVMLNFALQEALRPSLGPGLALPEAERQRSLVTAGASLGLDKVVAASLATQGDVTYLVGTIYDVRRGMLLREGRVRLSGQAAAPEGVRALASFLITGQASTLVGAGSALPPLPEAPKIAAAPAAPAAKAKPAARVAAPADSVSAQPKASSGLRWAAVGTGVVTLGLGAFALVEGLSAKSNYDSASQLLQSNRTLQPGTDPNRYDQFVSAGDSARTRTYIAAGAAVAGLAVTGLLWFLSAPSGEPAAPGVVKF